MRTALGVQRGLVNTVLVAGKVVNRGGVLVGVDLDALRERAALTGADRRGRRHRTGRTVEPLTRRAVWSVDSPLALTCLAGTVKVSGTPSARRVKLPLLGAGRVVGHQRQFPTERTRRSPFLPPLTRPE
ncbi:hypothetical protein [Amycolatopsis minnesotensis]|uniref:Uncharacterized protein n=1 Tax=Amycolatopsis minnesotensis TaxID=337894 RepID=A0ABN2RK06_9PSEU